jgi:hypothetical protein
MTPQSNDKSYSGVKLLEGLSVLAVEAHRDLRLVYLERAPAGSSPIGRIFSIIPTQSGVGRRVGYHIRAQMLDGTLWSGRSSGGGLVVTMRKLKESGHSNDTGARMRRIFQLPKNSCWQLPLVDRRKTVAHTVFRSEGNEQ